MRKVKKDVLIRHAWPNWDSIIMRSIINRLIRWFRFDLSISSLCLWIEEPLDFIVDALLKDCITEQWLLFFCTFFPINKIFCHFDLKKKKGSGIRLRKYFEFVYEWSVTIIMPQGNFSARMHICVCVKVSMPWGGRTEAKILRFTEFTWLEVLDNCIIN